MPSRNLPLLATLWLALLGLTLALSVLAAQHDTLPGDLQITTWGQGLPFPGQPLSDAVRAVTATQVVLAAGDAAARVGLPITPNVHQIRRKDDE